MVTVGYPHHPFVKAPMAESAECHAVADVVISAFTPRNYMGCFYNGMSIRSDDSYTTQSAAVIVGADNNFAESLITREFWGQYMQLPSLHLLVMYTVPRTRKLKSCWRKVKNSLVGSRLCSGSYNKSRNNVDGGSFWVVLSPR